MPGLVVPFVTFTLLYIFLAVVVVWLLLRQVAASPSDEPRRSEPAKEVGHGVA
jgi:cytochrome bd-type quinol oxidase subunit 1